MRPVVLLVDDDADFTLLVQCAFSKAWPEALLGCVNNGEEAMQYLLGSAEYADRKKFPAPSLVLLDLRMPRMNGFEFLKWKRNVPNLNDLPVIVWSTSNLPSEIERTHLLGAIAYVVKPISLGEYIRLISDFEKFWQLPFEQKKSNRVWSGFSNAENATMAH